MRYLTLDMYREELHILDPFSIFSLERPGGQIVHDCYVRPSRLIVQEGEESHDSFMASLTSHNDSRSLMPAESAFRMVSSLPPQGTEGGRPSRSQGHIEGAM